jgi:trehalose 6-phosphate phosphatase
MSLLLNPPPLADRDCALFLDFDGTLVDLALTPEAIAVSAEVPGLLQRLRILLDGAVAVVSGRPVAQIDRLLQPLKLLAAGVHGVERRGADGELRRQGTADLRPAAALVRSLVDAHPGLRLEEKDGAMALHYRLLPTLEPLCRHTMAQALALAPGMMLMHGKMVIEMKPQGASKGLAVQSFMQEAPFLHRRAWFFGDDVTDESGFEAVLAMGGVAVKVGAGPTRAPHRVADPAAVHQWLSSTAAHLSATSHQATS